MIDMSHCQKCGSPNVSTMRLADHVGTVRAVKIWFVLVVVSIVAGWIHLRGELNLWGALLIAFPSIWIAAPVGGLLFALVASIFAWLSTLRMQERVIACNCCGHITKLGDAPKHTP